MATVAEHDERHLARVYAWTLGGADEAIAAGREETLALGPPRTRGDLVVDLGAGFGKHAIPLAREGARVLAVDSSAHLASSLRARTEGLPIRVVIDDLLAFARLVDEAPAAVLCMGDTISHLPDLAAVEQLVHDAASVLAPRGLLAVSLRDYSIALSGPARFIPVRSDADRVLTCFLEYEPEVVRVHDLLHERTAQGWRFSVSDYAKLRLAPARLVACMEASGFAVRQDEARNGMVRIVAAKER